MEGRAHARQSYADVNEASLMQEDFDLFSEDLLASYKSRPPIRNNANTLKPEKGKVHVGIVGGGLAGLRCADVLLGRGFEVTILEARDSFGGRVSQGLLLGDKVDLGPNWIHGTQNNPILDLAQQTNITLCRCSEETLVFNEHGHALAKAKVEQCQEIMWSIINDAFRYSNQQSHYIGPQLSLKDYFSEQVRDRQLNEEDSRLILQMGEMWGSFVGDSWDQQSLKYFWLEECLDGDNLYVADTHENIISHAASRASRDAHVKFGTRVISIENQQSGSLQNPRLTVRTDSGSYAFDEVVVTVPLGCLKQKTIKFVPELPTAVHRALENTSYSRLEKVYITFPTAFWDSAGDTNNAVVQKFQRPQQRLSSFAHFLSPSYAPHNADKWALEVQSLSNKELFGSHARPTLLFTLFGPCATHISSLIASKDPSSKEYFDSLKSFFEPYYALLPMHNSNNPDCQPCGILATNWHHDELAGNGTYTNFKVSNSCDNDVALEDHFRVLREGMPRRGLWLAGEHTAPFVALGTLTGAYWSGEAIGVRISAAYGLLPSE